LKSHIIHKYPNPLLSDNAHPTRNTKSTVSAAPITSLRLDLVIYKEL
jgi:hypothetical protein